ncbi:MAG: PIG-L family deacetylase [Candidatus Omnitrophica bacterium]|nr:PIG-L family deacetylase [Candidatus Omnitrophota bacterium]
MSQNVLVVAVHPDDETLGCGGTILKHRQAGDQVYWLIVTAMRQEEGYKAEQIAARNKEIEQVASEFGMSQTFQLNFPTRKLDTVSPHLFIEKVQEVFQQIKPEIIYLPFMYDVHSDHRMAFDQIYSCTKIFRYPFIKTLYMMETLSETEFAPAHEGKTFVPNYFVNMDGFIEDKVRIMKIYSGEIGESPFPRSEENIRALATFRGATAGCKAAESFMMIKQIWR